MIEFLEYLFSSWYRYFGVVIPAYIVFYYVCTTVSRMWGRWLRYLNVRKHGWPPEHLDADGDWPPQPEDEDEN